MECKDWLREKLCDRELHLCGDIRAEAKAAGFNNQELKTARISLGVKTFHQFDEFGETPNWFWYMEV